MIEMKTALVTGASSGIGKAITERLLSEGYEVYGIGRNYPEASSPNMHPLCYDLTDTAGLPAFLKTSVPDRLSLLVNCAGCAYYGMHENLSPAAIHEMVTVNVEVPLLLSTLFLRGLRETKGTIINVSSVTAKQSSNTHGCAYGATKAALSHFSETLFEETRKSGIRVLTVHPDLTDTALYRNADFHPATETDCVLQSSEVADCVMYAINARAGMALTDITVRPQRNRIIRES